MPCFSPIPVKNPKVFRLSSDYKVNFVPCGKCIGCLQRRRDQWSIRIYEESKNAILSTFLTLTYNDEHLPVKMLRDENSNLVEVQGSLVKADLQKYFKRVRSVAPALRYYACGEYGSEGNRPHYHGIIINVPNNILVDKWSDDDGELGFVSCDPVTIEDIHYVTKYITNEDGDPQSFGYIKPFQLMSKGLGKEYINVTKDYHSHIGSAYYTSPGGVKHSLPRYYRDSLYTKDQTKELGEKASKEALQHLEELVGKDPLIRKKIYNAKKYRASQTSKSKKL